MEEDEDEEEPSSSLIAIAPIALAIDTQQELSDNIDVQARNLFLEGVELEQTGKLYDAILQYKKAFHLVPDIEFKVFNLSKEKDANANSNPDLINDKGATSSKKDNEASHLLVQDEFEGDLLSTFSKLSLQHQCICQPDKPTIDGHISSLPMEVLINILQWVLSAKLDLHSLESCSRVCRGFYLASRSSDIWRRVCLKTWNIESFEALSDSIKNNLNNEEHNWRKYFLANPRVHLNGCYIAKVSYMRQGERGFQDHELYRAWHVVQYYRLIRFFPGGKLVMVNTADEPAQAVKVFNNLQSTGITDSMNGRYRTVHDKVICVVQKNHTDTSQKNLKYKRGGKSKDLPYIFEVPDQVFHFEMQIKGKKFNQLHWLNYAVVSRYKSTGKTQQTEFNVKDIYSYPPLYFSRVKSYGDTESIDPMKQI